MPLKINSIMNNQTEYFKYLKTRSTIGLLYRKFWLYPRLNIYLEGKTLDIGCGIGDLLSYRKNTFGADINKNMVDWCKSQGYEAELIKNSILPFEDASYDSVIMDNVLEHIKDPEIILNEVRRVLIADGVFVVGVPGSYGFSIDPDHKVFYSSDKLVQIITAFGFKKKRLFNMPFSLKFLDKSLRQYCVYGVFKLNK